MSSSEQHTPQPPPDSVQAHLMAATALLRANEPDAAVRALESVVARAPGQPMPRYQLAVACAIAGHHERALANLGQAVEAGFRRPDLIEAEPAFAPYRSSSAYRTNLELARHNRHPCAGDPFAPRVRLLRRAPGRSRRRRGSSPGSIASRWCSAARP